MVMVMVMAVLSHHLVSIDDLCTHLCCFVQWANAGRRREVVMLEDQQPQPNLDLILCGSLQVAGNR
jgi:hypothetical protein